MYVSGFEDIFDKVRDFNERIEQLISERQNFMDSVMEEVSPFKVGEEYVNIRTGERVKVSKIYRGSSVGTGLRYYDDSLCDIHARFDNGDNTSRYGIEPKNPYIKAEYYDNNSELFYKKLKDLARYH